MLGTRTHPTRQDSRVTRATANRAAAGGQGAPHLQTEGEEDVALSGAPCSAPSLARPPLGRGSIPITAGLGDAIGQAAGLSHVGSLLLRAGLHNLSRCLPARAVLWLSPQAVLCSGLSSARRHKQRHPGPGPTTAFPCGLFPPRSIQRRSVCRILYIEREAFPINQGTPGGHTGDSTQVTTINTTGVSKQQGTPPAATLGSC